MQIPSRIVDDLKTDRKDITPPLQAVLRLVPVFFYAAIVGCLLLGTIFFAQLRLAEDRLRAHEARLAELEGEVTKAKEDRASLEAKILRAQDVEMWAKASKPIQPLAVTIARSIGAGSTIEDLKLDRVDALDPKIRLSLRIGTDKVDQLDRTIQALENSKFRVFTPEQSITRGEIDYHATLVQQDISAGEESTPTFR
jgi:hypothetical protein